jgi:hypothetical protein
MAETERRIVRLCDSCGGVDDHPRHVYGVVDGDGVTDPDVAAKAVEAASAADLPGLLAQIQDTATVVKHMDCCRDDGCPDKTCDEVTKGAEDKRGSDLVKHLTGGN